MKVYLNINSAKEATLTKEPTVDSWSHLNVTVKIGDDYFNSHHSISFGDLVRITRNIRKDQATVEIDKSGYVLTRTELSRFNVTMTISWFMFLFKELIYSSYLSAIPFLVMGVLKGNGVSQRKKDGKLSKYITSMKYLLPASCREEFIADFYEMNLDMKQQGLSRWWIIIINAFHLSSVIIHAYKFKLAGYFYKTQTKQETAKK